MRVDLGRSWRPNSTRAFCLVAVAALTAALGFARPLGQAHAATACASHSKRVVKHVKRHGKPKKVVRIKRYRTCKAVPTPDPIPTPAPSTPAPAPTPAPTLLPTPPLPVEIPTVTPPTTEPEPEANALGVAADDRGGVKKYTLTRETVRAGQLTVQLQNKGEDPHDMDIQRVGPSGEPLGEVVKVPVTEPGANTDASVTVEAGEYRMWCDLFSHAKEGMEATVKVE
jgi:plastocyanin